LQARGDPPAGAGGFHTFSVAPNIESPWVEPKFAGCGYFVTTLRRNRSACAMSASDEDPDLGLPD
jgi:hypothetical protein